MNKLKLQEKGWSEPDIRKAERLLEREERHDAHFAKMIFWSLFAVIVMAHLLVSAVLIPFLIVLDKIVLFSIVALLGIVIGGLYVFIIMDLGYLKQKHHLSAGILLPLIGLASVAVMTIGANKVMLRVGVQNQQHSPIVVGIVFAVAFLVPYAVHLFRQRGVNGPHVKSAGTV